MKHRDILPGKMIMGRVMKGDDLLKSLNDFAASQMIRLGEVSAIGALSKARLSAYDQEKFQYNEIALDEELEITYLHGNISMKDGRPFCHLHATLSRPDGSALGGHVMEGCTVFALEFVMKEFIGDDFIRQHDEDTGLPLWNI